MESYSKTVLILNPSAASGRAAKMWPEVRERARRKLGDFRAMITSRPGEAIRFAEESARAGADRLVCFGGDGILNEVVNGVMAADLAPEDRPAIGYVPCGTGMDFVRTAPVPRQWKDALDVAASGKTMKMDIGKISFRTHHGEAASRYFHNVASFGLGGEVDRKINRSKKRFGPVSFFRATFSAVVKYGRKRVLIGIDDRLEGFATIWNVAVCNGRTHGGGMKVAKKAEIDDGLFQVTILGDLNLMEVFCKFPKLYTGNLKGSKLYTTAGRKVWAASEETVLVDIDGECPGTLPLLAEIVPGAIRLIADLK